MLAGWTEGVGLDETGQQQVRDLSQRLRELPLAAIVSSPLQRCQETAAALADGRDFPVGTDVGLGECRYGAWTGQPIKDLAQDPLWRTVQDHPSAVTFPPSPDFEHESMPQMQARAVAAIRRIDAAVEADHGPHAIWVAVSHGDVIKALLADALGLHLDLFQRIVAAPASLSAVRYTGRRPFVLRSNDTGSPVDDLMPPAHADGPAEAPSGDATPGGTTGAPTVTVAD